MPTVERRRNKIENTNARLELLVLMGSISVAPKIVGFAGQCLDKCYNACVIHFVGRTCANPFIKIIRAKKDILLHKCIGNSGRDCLTTHRSFFQGAELGNHVCFLAIAIIFDFILLRSAQKESFLNQQLRTRYFEIWTSTLHSLFLCS